MPARNEVLIIDDVMRNTPEGFSRELFAKLSNYFESHYSSTGVDAACRFILDHPSALPNVAEVSYPIPYVEPAINPEPRKLFFAPFIQYFPELVHVEAFTSARII